MLAGKVMQGGEEVSIKKAISTQRTDENAATIMDLGSVLKDRKLTQGECQSIIDLIDALPPEAKMAMLKKLNTQQVGAIGAIAGNAFTDLIEKMIMEAHG